MKKQIIAAAVATVFAAPALAQNVSISGNLDMGYLSMDNKTDTYSRKVAAGGNNSSTSTIAITAVEDLGGGMKATVNFGNDLGTAPGGAATPQTLLNGNSFLGLSGGFGDIKAGNVNSKALDASSASQPFGTAIGSGYSGNFSRLSRGGVNGEFGAYVATAASTASLSMIEGEANASGIAASGARVVRANRTLAYTSPNFAGFQFGYSTVTKNGNSGAGNSSTIGAEEYAVSYSGNGLNVVAAQYSISSGSATTGLSSNETLRHGLLGANYSINNALTIYAGMTTSKNNSIGGAARTADSASRNFAVKYNVDPKITLMANMLTIDDKVSNKDRSLTGLGADYSLSKRTTAYARYESGDHDKLVTTGKFTNYSLGVRHTF